MKKLFIGVFAICSLFAGWVEEWTEGVACCICHDWLNAEPHFIAAINLLGNDHSHPYVWIDRAELYIILGREIEALEDLKVAFSSPFLNPSDYERALVNRMGIYLRLNMRAEAERDLEEFRKIHPTPDLEVYENKVIVRNIPDSECSRKIVKGMMLGMFCDSENDLIMSNSVCIANRTKNNCDCGPTAGPVEVCKEWCDDLAFTCQQICANTFKTGRCKVACAATVELLRKGCCWCCSQKKGLSTCVKPFSDIFEAMGGICDPAWD